MRVMRVEEICASVIFKLFLILLLTPVSSYAVPVSSFSESGSGFVFTLEDTDLNVNVGGDFALGADYQGLVSFEAFGATRFGDRFLPNGLGIGWDVQHIIKVEPAAGGTFLFPGPPWDDFSGTGFMIFAGDFSGGTHTIMSSASLFHPGGTFPGGAIGSGMDDYEATLEFVVRREGTPSGEFLYGLEAFKFTLTGNHVGVVPEPSTLLLVGSGLIGLIGLRKRK